MSNVVIAGLAKSFTTDDQPRALDGVDLQIDAGELLVLLGPSGCGKSTLLRCIAGLERPDAGSIEIGGRCVTDAGRNVFVPPNQRALGMVFQNYVLWPHMTVRQNVTYPLKVRGEVGKGERGALVERVLDLVQCTHLADRYPSQLSGGQQQRIALARALVGEPAVLLLDEPLSNLDALLRVELRRHLREVHRRVRYTGVYVTHDQAEALAIGTRVAVMRSGRIEQLAAPEELYRRPGTEFVADFLGIRNRLTLVEDGPVWISEAGPIDPSGLPLDSARGRRVRLLLKAEHLVLQPTGSPPLGPDHMVLGEGVVDDVLFTGDERDYVVRIGTTELEARRPSSEPALRAGDAVRIGFPRMAPLVYVDGKLVPSAEGAVDVAAGGERQTA